ncbi:ATPase [Bacillus sp. DJP31]|uniref:ATPase n=1 Tax=Bacillus sp. DJP31 TaxID=3409789 RepID=UPI003BB659A3
MRDVLFYLLDEKTELVITTDSSGGIGLKDGDLVKAPDEIVGYYTARVALMENLSVGGDPFALIIQNFTGDSAWTSYKQGVDRAVNELNLPPLPLIGSSESNFSLHQSGFGLTVLGRTEKKRIYTPDSAGFAVIGVPLVGEEVLTRKDLVLPLSLFHELLSVNGIYEIVPIGSKGIYQEWKLLCDRNQLLWTTDIVSDTLNLIQSSGPATSVLISYNLPMEESIKKVTGSHFHKIRQS